MIIGSTSEVPSVKEGALDPKVFADVSDEKVLDCGHSDVDRDVISCKLESQGADVMEEEID